MRTTIDLDVELLAALRERAAQRRTTFSRVVEDAVKAYLERPAPNDIGEPFELLTAGHRGGHSPTPERVLALLDEDEVPIRTVRQRS